MGASILMLACFAMERPDAELIHFSSIANSLKKLGNNVSIYHLSLSGAPAIRSLLDNGISFHEQTVHAEKNNAMFIRGSLKVTQFIGYLLKEKPDIIYARLGIVSGVFCIAARILLRKRIKIITEHNGWIGPEAKASGKPLPLVLLGKELQRMSSQVSDIIRAVSPGIKSYLVSLGIRKEKISVIGNGTDIAHFRPLDAAPDYDVGFIGNFAKWQGLDWLVEAFARVLEKRPEAKLAIGGAGPEEKDLQSLIKNLGIEGKVELTGLVPYQDASMFINRCKICVAPFRPRGSVSDNKSISPLKIRDYSACGKPIVSSRIPGLEEIENGGFGILVQPGDIPGLAEAIISLLDNPDLCMKMGKRAREYAVSHYSWDHIASEISRLINTLGTSDGRQHP